MESLCNLFVSVYLIHVGGRSCNCVILQKQNMLGCFQTYDLESRFPALFDLMMALRSTETRNITLKNLALFRPKLYHSYSTNQIERFVNYFMAMETVMEFSIR